MCEGCFSHSPHDPFVFILGISRMPFFVSYELCITLLLAIFTSYRPIRSFLCHTWMIGSWSVHRWALTFLVQGTYILA